MKKLRIGVMGFKGDPLHWMHVLIAELGRVQQDLDLVYCVTAGEPVDKKDVTDKEIRHKMVVATVGGDPYLIPSRLEIDREGPSYTTDTLRELRKIHGDDAEYFLIIGEDRAPTIKDWHEADLLVQMCTFLIAPRMNTAVDKDWVKSVLPEGARFDIIQLEMSSTFIRKQIEQGRSVRWLVPPGVHDVITTNNLYAPKTEPAPTPIEENPAMTTPTSAPPLAVAEPEAKGTSVLGTIKSTIVSILDTDLYKLTMAWAVLMLYPNVKVAYQFTDRRGAGKWTQEALECLKQKIALLANLALTKEERVECEARFPWINRVFWDFLAAYRFDPSEVEVWLDKKNNLQLKIKGLWCRTIFWEVPLLALIQETYFEKIDTNWNEDGQEEKMEDKAKRLFDAGVSWGDFGTRRRRHLAAQERVVRIGCKYANFTGTSNVYLAIKYGVKALGTVAHEWIMAHAALFSLKHANRYAMEAWNRVYQGNLGTALPDTYGTPAFLRDFNGVLARLFDSVRHDSGNPFKWAEMMIAHYMKLAIDWKSKPLGFTDGNTVDSAIEIHVWIHDKGGKCWFGIGTSMSNDYGPDSPAVPIVIKLTEVEDEDGTITEVVKLGDGEGKTSGASDAIRVARHTHMGTPLDFGMIPQVAAAAH